MKETFIDPLCFEPNDQAWQQRLARVDADQYARSRNHLTGQVSYLSPYLTHGFIQVADVVQVLSGRFSLHLNHRLVMELGWREYFQHTWRCLNTAIFSSRVAPPAPPEFYQPHVPDDLRQAATGIPAIDQAVHALYSYGYLHNHARLWLAAYAVHLRKIDWHCAARWMYGHLLDGDLASNSLSWQWVAGTLTGTPYVFNAQNVELFAPPNWHSAGSVLDQDYEAIRAIAREARRPAEPAEKNGLISDAASTIEPTLFTQPMPLGQQGHEMHSHNDGNDAFYRLAQSNSHTTFTLIHPWSLKDTTVPRSQQIGLVVLDFHQQWPWSRKRWDFVMQRLHQLCEYVLVGTQAELVDRLAAHAQRLTAQQTLNPGYNELLTALATQGSNLLTQPRFFFDPPQCARSFSAYWRQVQRHPPALLASAPLHSKT